MFHYLALKGEAIQEGQGNSGRAIEVRKDEVIHEGRGNSGRAIEVRKDEVIYEGQGNSEGQSINSSIAPVNCSGLQPGATKQVIHKAFARMKYKKSSVAPVHCSGALLRALARGNKILQ